MRCQRGNSKSSNILRESRGLQACAGLCGCPRELRKPLHSPLADLEAPGRDSEGRVVTPLPDHWRCAQLTRGPLRNSGRHRLRDIRKSLSDYWPISKLTKQRIHTPSCQPRKALDKHTAAITHSGWRGRGGRTLISRLATLRYLKFPVFNHNKIWDVQRNRK